MNMALNPGTIFVALTLTILVLIGIVVILEKTLKKRKEIAIKDPAYEFTEQLREIKKANLEPQEMISRIGDLAKKAITGQSTAGHLDYSQIAEINKEKHHIVQFCLEMTQTLYAGERVTPSQAKSLLNALEDLLKGEGKLILITPKKEIIEGESTFFLDKIIENLAKKVNSKLQEYKQDKQDKQNKKIEQKKEEATPVVEETKEIEPEFKKEVLIRKNKTSKKTHPKDKHEYKYIESVDVLDRIQNKLKERKTAI
ncbi:MAG TPA: hypothetical protein VHA12_03515 [Candidatus Nanoarchaeia archaeon]|nr:hypothetical protein [Candidatus Nanoarchaeia archaeon]